MFFIFAITQKRDDLELKETRNCNICGSLGGYKVFVEYNALSLFFIPVFKWGRKYFMKADCCGSLFLIPEDKGRNIERGKNISIADDDLIPIYRNDSKSMACAHCGYSVDIDHTFCPNCGNRL